MQIESTKDVNVCNQFSRPATRSSTRSRKTDKVAFDMVRMLFHFALVLGRRIWKGPL